MTAGTARRNYVDFYSETGELLLAHDMDRPVYQLANILTGYQNRAMLGELFDAAGVQADRDAFGDAMTGWGQSFGETSQVAEHVFESTGTIHLVGGKIDGNRCDYTLTERMGVVRYVHRTDWN